jgi:hypothetical protein
VEWHRAARVPGLQQRIVSVLQNPINGELDIQLDILAQLLKQGARLQEDEWVAWAGYAFAPPANGAL